MAENGPWDADITQQFIRPLVDNLTAVLQADWVADAPVHAEVNNDVLMATYKVWRRSRWVNTLFPACSVIPGRTRTRKGEDDQSVDETHSLEILIEDVGPNPDTLADNVMKRVQAAHLIIERTSLASLFAGYQPSRTLRPYWDIDHDYAQFWLKTMSKYKQNGSLIITFTGLMEKT